MPVPLEVVNVACERACAEDDKRNSKLFAERDAAKKGRHEVGHGKLNVLFRQVVPGASKGGGEDFTCGKMSRSDGDTGDVMGPDAAEHSVLLGVIAKICESDVAHARLVDALHEETISADGKGRTAEGRQRPSDGEGLVHNRAR